jgi:cytochrome c2
MRALILLAPALAACQQQTATTRLIAERCGACHIVPGVAGANGRVGPSLAGIGRQQIIAGHFPNSRPALTAWISRPQSLLPGDAMPDTGLTPDQAAAVADYLYTLDK